MRSEYIVLLTQPDTYKPCLNFLGSLGYNLGDPEDWYDDSGNPYLAVITYSDGYVSGNYESSPDWQPEYRWPDYPAALLDWANQLKKEPK